MQALLTYAIEIVFWSFTLVFIFDFVNGLFPQLPDLKPRIWEIEPEKEPENAPLPDEVFQNVVAPIALPDPWLEDIGIALPKGVVGDIAPPDVKQAIAPTPLALPAPKRLPPAPTQIAQMQSPPKRKRGRPRKSA